MFNISNILEIIDDVGEDKVRKILSSFISENDGVEQFIRKKAIEFAKKKWSITYLVSDSRTNELLGVFTLAVKAANINPSINISNRIIKKVKEFSIEGGNSSNKEIISTAYLLAQFGKNSKYKTNITGEMLLEEALTILNELQRRVGGRLLWLECESTNEKALRFYQNTNLGFKIFNTRHDEETNITYIQMIKSI